jgi:hypothetical protein
VKLHRRPEIVKRRADIQNLPAILLELSKSRTTNIKRPLQIDIHHCPETVGRQLLGGTKKIPRRTVDDDIDLAELLDRLCNGLFHLLRLSNVSRNSYRLAAFLIDRLRRRFKVVHLPTDERHGRTRFRKCTRDSARNARSTASHERHSPLQYSFVKYALTHDSDPRSSA